MLSIPTTPLTAWLHSPYSTHTQPLQHTCTPVTAHLHLPCIYHFHTSCIAPGESNSTPYVCSQDTYGLELDSPGGMQEGQPSANPYLMAATLLIDRTGQWHLPAAAVVLKLGLQCCAKRRKHRPRQVTHTRSWVVTLVPVVSCPCTCHTLTRCFSQPGRNESSFTWALGKRCANGPWGSKPCPEQRNERNSDVHDLWMRVAWRQASSMHARRDVQTMCCEADGVAECCLSDLSTFDRVFRWRRFRANIQRAWSVTSARYCCYWSECHG